MGDTIRKARTDRAFTLLELLAVVGILAVLVSIAVPALSRAREQAKTVVCASQLRECFSGLFHYAEDYQSWLPYMGSYYQVRKFAHPKADQSWPAGIAPYLQDEWGVHRCPSDRDPVRVGVIGREVLPIDTRTPPAPGQQTALFSFRGEERRQGRLTDPKHPHEAILLVEGRTHPLGADDHFHALLRPPTNPFQPDPPATSGNIHASFRRHGGRSNFLFFSGAVRTIRASALHRVQEQHLAAGLLRALGP